MEKIIKNPDVVLGSGATYETASFDGKLWNHPEVFYKIQSMVPNLPHIHELLVAFFRGAHTTWSRFIEEYEPGSVISGLSAQECKQANMEATNDANEGVLGSYRQTLMQHRNMTESTFNAKTSYKRNGMGEYMQTLTAEDRSFLKQKARDINSSGLEAKHRKLLATQEKEAVEKKRQQDKVKQGKKDEFMATLDSLNVIMTVEDLESSLSCQVPRKKDVSKKDLKIEALRTAIIFYNNLTPTHNVQNDPESSEKVDMDEDCTDDEV
ncbi:hypothetical protein M422DRAFT_253203 [Sphaerobolus stellatus SS14]|uniref:Uncharacterized protein n=1 Tax=Sphaerobolus stellatus (strain SS14) TaxID=990650 RepID=A0A0C9VNL5_SPHS4|nr:hypothetical protein M422DRAFT_253203 [Sphaerobolus stellatus SS14]